MSLEVQNREEHQAVGIYEDVCLVVRWTPIAEADLISYSRALAKLNRRCPGGIAFLQVNRFSPTKTVDAADSADAAMIPLLSQYGSALRIIAVALPNAPLVAAGLRNRFARIALTTRNRLNFRPFDDLTEATTAVCEAMKAPGLRTLYPYELVDALAELERERQSPINRSE